jgi:hypothetical protein
MIKIGQELLDIYERYGHQIGIYALKYQCLELEADTGA